MQQTQIHNFHNPRLSTSSHSSLSAATTALLNGLLPSHRFSQTSANAHTLASNLTPHQLKELQKTNNKLKRIKKIKHASIITILTIVLALLLIITIELSKKLVTIQSNINRENITLINNRTYQKQYPIRAFFTCVWIFNGLLFLNCFIIHSIIIQQRSRRGRTTIAFLREFGGIFDNSKASSNNTLIDFLLKTCLLCLLWYLSCYFIFRSMTILLPVQIIILYSITITLRQLLGWIFLHEQFIGNKIIAYILGFSGLLFLAHNDGFRFNRFFLGLSMVTCSVAFKTTFDILVNSFIKDLTHTKLRIVMINVCLCGTCLLWPFVLLLSFAQIEIFDYKSIPWILTGITLVSSLLFNVLVIVISFKYSSTANTACLLFVIPALSIIDQYLFAIKYSPLVISAIICSFSGVLLSLIPKEWFQASETNKMKQALGLLNKDPSTNPSGLHISGTTTTGTSSAFEEIRAQRRIRNALLYNEGKT